MAYAYQSANRGIESGAGLHTYIKTSETTFYENC